MDIYLTATSRPSAAVSDSAIENTTNIINYEVHYINCTLYVELYLDTVKGGDCEGLDILGDTIENSSVYLFPFIIEYSMIGGQLDKTHKKVFSGRTTKVRLTSPPPD